MLLLPLLERLARRSAIRRGIASRVVATSRGPLHVYDAKGSGPLPTIVVLHGIATSGAPFLPLVGLLRERARRVLLPESPGHGFSEKPAGQLSPKVLEQTMIELLDAQLDEPAIVFGSSLGGAMALRYGLARPENVRALVLASPAGARLAPAQWDALRATFDVRSTADARRFVGRLYHRTPTLAKLLARDVGQLLQRDAVREIIAHASDDDFFSPEEIGSLSRPALLLWGKSERLLPDEALAYFRAHLPTTARIEEPHGFAHCPHVDDPRRLADYITGFAAS